MLNIKKRQRGISLYFAIVVLSILLGIGVGLNEIILPQMKMIRQVGNSIFALHAADTGIEKALYCLYQLECQGCERENPNSLLPFRCSGTVGEASFKVNAIPAGESNCPTSTFYFYCLKSFGTYKSTQRAVEAFY